MTSIRHPSAVAHISSLLLLIHIMACSQDKGWTKHSRSEEAPTSDQISADVKKSDAAKVKDANGEASTPNQISADIKKSDAAKATDANGENTVSSEKSGQPPLPTAKENITTKSDNATDPKTNTTNATIPPSTGSSGSTSILSYGSNSPTSNTFSVSVSSLDKTVVKNIPVELVRQSNSSLNFARFAFSGKIQISVKVPSISRYSISPKKYGIAVNSDNTTQTMSFTISNEANNSYYQDGSPIRLVIHDNYSTAAKLFILADKQKESIVPNGADIFDAVKDFGISPADKDNTAKINSAIQTLSAKNIPKSATLYFPAGIYRTGTVLMKSNVTVHLAGDATLMRAEGATLQNAMVLFDSVKNAHLTGPGIVNADLWRATSDRIIRMYKSSESSLEDVTMTGTGTWSIHILQCSNITGRNYKLINELTENSDGTDPDHSKHILIENIFEHTNDDAFAIKTSTSAADTTEDVRIVNNVVWTQKSALKIGSEVRKGITGVKFIGNNVIVADRGMALYGNGKGTEGGFTDGVEYADNVFEKIFDLTQGKLLEFQVQYFSNSAPYAPIRNVVVKNTFVYSKAPNISTISGKDGVTISNVSFSSLWFDDAGEWVSTANNNVNKYFSIGADAVNITFTGN
ncbi:MAG: hypothetical protein HQK54_06555 [Oligoflexales bacterium]|nr:hypothetical protein [Oligoflexales bacterium]